MSQTKTFDPQRALAILIGMSAYTDFTPIPPAKNNVTQLARLLADPAVFGLSPERIKPLVDLDAKNLKRMLMQELEAAKKQKITQLLLYYAGHGFGHPDGSYFLTATDSDKALIRADKSTALDFQFLKKILRDANLPQNILILDACYSGLASLDGTHHLPELDLKGHFLLASSDANEVSFFDTDASHTVFTGELLQLLEQGLPHGREWVSLQEFSDTVTAAVKQKQPGMNPQQTAKQLQLQHYHFYKNRRYDPQAARYQRVEEEIAEGNELIEKGKITVAHNHFWVLQREIRNDLAAGERQEELAQRVAEMLDMCAFLLQPTVQQATDPALVYGWLRDHWGQLTAGRTDPAELTQLRTELAARKQEVQQLTTALAEQTATLAQLQKDEATARKQAQALHQENTSLQQQLTTAQAQVVSLTQQLAAQTQALADLQAEWEELTALHPAVLAATENMVHIQGGTFEMGDTFGEGSEEEQPVHQVTLRDFWLGCYAVTFEEYDTYCTATGSTRPGDAGWGRGRRPVINVSWQDAVLYCNWLSEQQGLTPVYTLRGEEVSANWEANGYRLPTEAEWEYAAREGGRQVRFGNGKDVAYPSEINFDASEGNKQPYSGAGEYRKKTEEVGSLNCPNALGLHDMSGNVWEWCWDWYGDYLNKPQVNPTGPEKGTYRVGRGGSWSNTAKHCRIADRYGLGALYYDNIIGFRLARS